METKDPSESHVPDPKSEENLDMISNLPEPIIHRIFSFLETIDVIRASAVCKKWRYFWVSLPYLNFNIHSVWNDLSNRWSLQTIHEKFKDFVNWVLAFQDRTCDIQRFRLSCINFPDDYAIQRWMNIVTSRCVKEIELYILSRTPFQFPSCLLTSESLVALKLSFLQDCILKLPTIAGFSHLKTLKLTHVGFKDEIVFESFIVGCSLLEKLQIKGCAFHSFSKLSLRSWNLKELILIQSNEYVVVNIEIMVACQNLRSFKYYGPLPQKLLLRNLFSLEHATLFIQPIDLLSKEKRGYVVGEALRGLLKVKTLKLNALLLEYLHGKTNSTHIPVFNNVKSLWLIMASAGQYLEILMEFLKCSPNLEALKLELEPKDELEVYWEVPDETNACLTHHLKTVDFFNIGCNKNESELIKFLLKHGRRLEEMRIKWAPDAEIPTQSINKIMNFTRSSPNVSFTFLEPMFSFASSVHDEDNSENDFPFL